MDPKHMTQDQRQALWEQAGHSGIAPVGYGGEAGSGGGGGGGGTQPLSAPDVAKLREQVYQALQPYYVQLAKEAQGDFNRAVSQMHEDYTKGVREQRVQYEFTKKQQTDELNNTLAALGISNTKEQEDSIDKLNQRGMAVYQNNPDGSYNVVKPSQITGDSGSAVSTIANPQDASMGRGGYELAQLQRDQQLRQEAQQRAAIKPIESAGIQLKQYTNLPAGVDPNLPPDQLAKALAAPGVDRSQLGSAEQNLIRGQEDQTRNLQKEQENLANQRSSDINQIATPLAQTGTKSIDSSMTNQINKERQNTFINTGS